MNSMNKQFFRIGIGIVIGIIISVIISTIFITIGYSAFNSRNLTEYVIKILGIPIFSIVNNGNGVVGTPNVENMTMLGIGWSVIVVFVIEIIHYAKNKNEK